MKKIFNSIFFLAACSLCLNAQPTLTDKTVYSFFSKSKKILWIEYYKGKIDGINDISVALAYDGKSCKGLLTYLKSGERFRLDGVLEGNDLMLLEVDQDATVTGQMEGYIEGKNIHLNWTNIDNTLASDIFLIQIPKEETSPIPCDYDKWIRIYKGTIFGSKVDLILQKYDLNSLKGVAYFENEDKSYDLRGEVVDFETININFKDDKNKTIGKLEGVLEEENSFSANFFASEGQRCPTLFLNENKLNIDCIEYADYITSYGITFPKTPNNNFNRWMEKITSDWIKTCQEHALEVKSINAVPKPELRSTVRAYAWCDIDFYDEYLISGFMTFENTWTKGLEGKAINYDLKNGKELNLKDLFNETFDYKVIVAEYLNEEIDQHELYKDYSFRKWLSTQEFSHFLIHKDGLSFCTAFNSVYGRQKIKIPYDKLKPFLKENNVLEYLIN